jgi:hypothetical protein
VDEAEARGDRVKAAKHAKKAKKLGKDYERRVRGYQRYPTTKMALACTGWGFAKFTGQ